MGAFEDLKLSTETLRELSGEDLSRVAGGAATQLCVTDWVDTADTHCGLTQHIPTMNAACESLRYCTV